MRIIADVMSGDNAPLELLKGVCQAVNEYGVNVTVVGKKSEIEYIAEKNDLNIQNIDVINADEIISMEDDPISVVRTKSNSSMSVGLKLLSEGYGTAFVSAGNTGALFTGASLIVRKIKGVQRAAIATVLPMRNPVLLLDSGANLIVTDEYMEQFAIMGTAYMKNIYKIDSPRVGLLNNGTEKCKGTPLQIESYKKLCRCEHINFVGNIEGNAIPNGACDVIVTDGFSGNILLKTIEGMGKLMLSTFKDIFYDNVFTKFSALVMKKNILKVKKKFDSSEHGGAPILGISKPVIKAHGSSNANAFKNAIRQAVLYVENGVIKNISDEIADIKQRKKEIKDADSLLEQ
jgi:glycerol-3-phosphate acyltransferase PlsX